jgi:ATP synthase F1 epsilon subunit
MATLHVDVVSAEESIFSGEAKFVALPGEGGELGILPRHTPLITRIRPGAVRIQRADNGEEEELVTVDDEQELNAVYDLFMEALFDEDEE